MLCGRAAIRCRRGRIQIGLKQRPRARGVSKNHRIDVLRKRNRIKLKRLTALADDLLPLISFDCADLLRRLTIDRKSTRLNSSHRTISYAVFCLKKKKYRNANRSRTFARE